jgi:DNA-binding protein H-NS
MSSTNAKTRDQLLQEAADIARQLEDEVYARIARIQAEVTQLKSEGIPIKLLIEGRRNRAAKEGAQGRDRKPKIWRDPVTGAEWSGHGHRPFWYDRRMPTDAYSQAVASAEMLDAE